MIGRLMTACSLGAVLLLAGCTAGGGAAAPAPARTPAGSPPAKPSPEALKGPYVALGDSYTSGLQVKPLGDGPRGCYRSRVNYPSLVAQELGIKAADFTDVSCSSATTADLTAAQQVEGGPNPPQLDALSERTRLVTVGIGGNDAGFMQVAAKCAEEGVAQLLVKGDDSPCRAYYSGAGDLAGRLNTVGERLAGVLQEVRRRAPQARVYVVGYPALLPADPAGCLPVLGRAVAPGDLSFLAEKEQQLDSVLRDRARAAGAGYVDTYAPSAGHDMCAGEAARWIEPPFPAAGRAPLHPNAAGQQAMARIVAAAVRTA